MDLDSSISIGQFTDLQASRNIISNAREDSATERRIIPDLIEVGARSSQSIVALNTRCQTLGIQQPHFDYHKTSDARWAGELSFPNAEVDELRLIQTEQTYTSKQGVKEALSKQALDVIDAAVKEGRIKKAQSAGNRVSKHTVALHDKHQKLGLPKPHYEYEGSAETGFKATVTFPGLDLGHLRNIGDSGLHPNKSGAKEAASKVALEALNRAESLGELKTLKAPERQLPGTKEAAGSNYVGQLLEFLRAIDGPQPIYRDFQSGIRFTCLVEIDDYPGPFGSTGSLHPSKKSARQEAACHAVNYFKDQGLWPDDSAQVGGIKKRPKISQDSRENLLRDSALPAGSTSWEAPSTTAVNSYPQQVVQMSQLLALGTPNWKFIPSVLGSDAYTVQCFFRGAGPHEGPHGEVCNIVGKKKAKEECARLTLEYLNGLRTRRLAYGQLVLKDNKGLTESPSYLSESWETEALDAEKQFVNEMWGEVVEKEYSKDAVEQISNRNHHC